MTHAFWTNREIAIVREHYPRGGINACLPLLSRSRSAIYRQSQQLKLCAPGYPSVRQAWPKSADIDARLIWLHQRPLDKGVVVEFAQRVGRPIWWVSKRARELGLKTPRFRELPWVRAEIELLRATAHLTTRAIRERFKKSGFVRSETAIHVKRKREQISVVQARQDAGLYNAHQVSELFGVDSKTVVRWISMHELKSKREAGFLIVREKDLRAFVIKHPLRIELRKIPDSSRTWFIELLAGRGGISVGRAA